MLEATLAARSAKLGADHPSTLSTQNNLALAYRAAGRLDQSIALLERTLVARTAKHGAENPRTLTTRLDLAMAYRERGDLGRAEAMLRETLAARRSVLGPEHPDVADALAALGGNLLRQRRWADAEPILREALAIRDTKRPDDWSRFEARSLLGESLLGQKKYGEAEPLLLTGYEGLESRKARQDMAAGKIRLAEAGGACLAALRSLGQAREGRRVADDAGSRPAVAVERPAAHECTRRRRDGAPPSRVA